MTTWSALLLTMRCWEVIQIVDKEITLSCGLPFSKEEIDSWDVVIRIIRRQAPCEVEVSTLGTSFHMIFGSYEGGNFLCIPNLRIGIEMSSLTDVMGNWVKLEHVCPKLSDPALESIVNTLSILEEHVTLE